MLVIKKRGGAIFSEGVAWSSGAFFCFVLLWGFLMADSSDFSPLFVSFYISFLLRRNLRPPSVLHALDRLGREAVVTTGSAHSRDTDFQGARQSLRAGNNHATEQTSID